MDVRLNTIFLRALVSIKGLCVPVVLFERPGISDCHLSVTRSLPSYSTHRGNEMPQALDSLQHLMTGLEEGQKCKQHSFSLTGLSKNLFSSIGLRRGALVFHCGSLV